MSEEDEVEGWLQGYDGYDDEEAEELCDITGEECPGNKGFCEECDVLYNIDEEERE